MAILALLSKDIIKHMTPTVPVVAKGTKIFRPKTSSIHD